MKQDPKLVAAKQKFEVAYVAKKFKVTQKKVREVMAILGNNGKMCRSRVKIEKYLKTMV